MLRTARALLDDVFADDPLTEDVEHVLPTHGEPVVGDGAAALRDALESDPTTYRVADMSPAVRPRA